MSLQILVYSSLAMIFSLTIFLSCNIHTSPFYHHFLLIFLLYIVLIFLKANVTNSNSPHGPLPLTLCICVYVCQCVRSHLERPSITPNEKSCNRACHFISLISIILSLRHANGPKAWRTPVFISRNNDGRFAHVWLMEHCTQRWWPLQNRTPKPVWFLSFHLWRPHKSSWGWRKQTMLHSFGQGLAAQTESQDQDHRGASMLTLFQSSKRCFFFFLTRSCDDTWWLNMQKSVARRADKIWQQPQETRMQCSDMTSHVMSSNMHDSLFLPCLWINYK